KCPKVRDLLRLCCCILVFCWVRNNRKYSENPVFRSAHLPNPVPPFPSNSGRIPNAIASSIRVLPFFVKWPAQFPHSSQREKYQILYRYRNRTHIPWFQVLFLNRLQ